MIGINRKQADCRLQVELAILLQVRDGSVSVSILKTISLDLDNMMAHRGKLRALSYLHSGLGKKS